MEFARLSFTEQMGLGSIVSYKLWIPRLGWSSRGSIIQLRSNFKKLKTPENDQPFHMAMDQYLLIPFLVGWTSIYQLFWCSPGVQGFDTLPYHFTMFWGLGLQTTPNEDLTSGFFGSTASRRVPCLGSGFESMGFFGTFQLLGLSP